jgi:uncharacterized protein YraI
MKRSSLLILVLVVALMLAAIPAAFAQESITITLADTAANIRTGDGLEYSTRGTFYGGELSVTGRSDFDASRLCRGDDTDYDMWLRIDHFGVEGWIARCVVTVTGDLASVPVVEPSSPVLISSLYDDDNELPELADEIGDAPESNYVYGFTRSRVNFREAPGLDAEVIRSLAATQAVYVIGRNADNTWVQVTLNGETGWIARYLVFMPINWENTVPVK